LIASGVRQHHERWDGIDAGIDYIVVDGTEAGTHGGPAILKMILDYQH